MGLVDQLRQDVQAITTNNSEFAIPVALTASTGETAETSGVYSKHHLAYDTEGVRVNSRQTCITISEAPLISQYYPTRDADGNISFDGHKVVMDSVTYICDQWFEDNTAGTILLILGDFES